MRKISCFLLPVIILVAACTSSKELLQEGKYHRAIEKSAEALRKDPNDAEEFYVLKEAYRQANLFDQERIEFLEKENRDENWLEIYFLHSQLERRQDVIRSLRGSIRSQFALVDYNDEIIQSKQSAAKTMYQQGLEYLDRGDRQSARLAYEEFVEVKSIYADYKDVNRLLEEARYLGTNFVLFQIENNSDVVLPEYFESELKKIGLSDLNTQWLQYETYADTSIYYNYYVVLNIKRIGVTPETVDQRSYTETKEIQDGMKYVLDQNGNVKKDSLGNDIRVPNMVTISAEVKESVQHKEAVVAGSIDYIDLQSNQLMKTEKISVNAVFEHFSAVVSGDKRALSDESRQKTGSRPIPFPPNEAMLIDAADLLKNRAKAVVYQNRDLLVNY